MLENLIYAGTFDTFGYNRSELIAVYDTVLDRVAKDVNAKASGQFSFFDMEECPPTEIPRRREFSQADKLRWEKQCPEFI